MAAAVDSNAEAQRMVLEYHLRQQGKVQHLWEVPVVAQVLSMQQAALPVQGFMQMRWRAGPLDLPLAHVLPRPCPDHSILSPQRFWSM